MCKVELRRGTPWPPRLVSRIARVGLTTAAPEATAAFSRSALGFVERGAEECAGADFARLMGLPGDAPFPARRPVAQARHRHRAHQSPYTRSRTAATSACISPSSMRATRLPGMNCLQQQARFGTFVQEFNAEWPHEASA